MKLRTWLRRHDSQTDTEHTHPETHRQSTHRRRSIHLVIPAVTIIVLSTGLILADTLRRPYDIALQVHIEICKKDKQGTWQVIDEVGPTNARFSASIMDLAAGRNNIESKFVLETKSKKGHRYSARLAKAASVKFNPNSRSQADLVLDVTYGNARAQVSTALTTGSLSSPIGNRRGKPVQGLVKGLLGQDPASATFVSANHFRPTDGSEPLLLVVEEQYTLTPKGAGRKG